MCPRSTGSGRRRVLVVVARQLVDVGVDQLLELHEQSVVDAVVAEADRAEHEGVVGSDAEVATGRRSGRFSEGGRSFSTLRSHVEMALTWSFSQRTVTRWRPWRALR